MRKRGILELYVDDQFILRETREIWQRMGGRRSDVPGAAMRGGSGLLQVLTWTPLVIDDLRLEGTLLEAWKKDKAEEEADRKASKDN